MKNTKIFDLVYLENNDLTDDDLFLLLNDKSLNLSLIYGMFKYHTDYNFHKKDILNIILKQNWQDEYFFKNKKHKNNFEKRLIKIFKNIFYYRDVLAKERMQFWMIYYGLRTKKM